jgi:hypothetical protein
LLLARASAELRPDASDCLKHGARDGINPETKMQSGIQTIFKESLAFRHL